MDTIKLYNAVSHGPKCMPPGAKWALQQTINDVITHFFMKFASCLSYIGVS